MGQGQASRWMVSCPQFGRSVGEIRENWDRAGEVMRGLVGRGGEARVAER